MVAGMCIIGAALLAGCFETTLNIGLSADAKVDPAMCGEWTFSWHDGEENKTAAATILNFDDKQYYVSWRAEGEKEAHIAAFLVQVKDATFAQMRGLDADVDDKHVIVRAKMSGTKLMFRHLKSDFFSGVDTDEKLRAKIGENINNEEMYQGPWLTGALVGQP
jgi:hypothetical protein